MSAGRCRISITLAMVKVLPEPVTPSSTWSRSLARACPDKIANGGRLVARRLVGADQLEALAAFRFLGPRRTMRHEPGDFRAGRAMQRQVAYFVGRERHIGVDLVEIGRPGIVGRAGGLDRHRIRRRAELCRVVGEPARTAPATRCAGNHSIVMRHGENIGWPTGLCIKRS